MTRALSRILCVEDGPDIQQIVKLALQAVGGFRVQVCSSASEAVERGPAFAPQLVLLDYMLPGMDGGAAVTIFRGVPVFEKLPIIFVTARVQPQEVEQYTSLGAVGVIAKPFDPLTLSKKVDSLWAQCHDA